MTKQSADQQPRSCDDEALSKLGHDIRQCFFVMRTGCSLLRSVREDPDRFDEVCGMMETEERKAAALLEELVALARRRGKRE